jgi:phospholipase/carboxylesterase
MTRIDGPRIEPRGGPAKRLVVFLHGYGADGNDLIDIGRLWAPRMPDTAFVSPHAPEPCSEAPTGRQWFPLAGIDPTKLREGVLTAAPILNEFLDQELARHQLTDDRLALVGFSQGTMLALAVGLRRNPALAAIVGYSGALASAEGLPEPGKGPAVLLVHGDMDEVIPVDAMMLAREQLAMAGLPVEWHVAPGVGHGIDAEGLRLGAAFLKQAFAAATAVQ